MPGPKRAGGRATPRRETALGQGSRWVCPAGDARAPRTVPTAGAGAEDGTDALPPSRSSRSRADSGPPARQRKTAHRARLVPAERQRRPGRAWEGPGAKLQGAGPGKAVPRAQATADLAPEPLRVTRVRSPAASLSAALEPPAPQPLPGTRPAVLLASRLRPPGVSGSAGHGWP